MPNERTGLPDPIGNAVAGYRWHRATIGESAAETFRLERPGGQGLYLKISPRLPRRELLEESKKLDWLDGKLPAPEVLAFGEDSTSDYLLVSAIDGVDAAGAARDIAPAELVRLLAKALGHDPSAIHRRLSF